MDLTGKQKRRLRGLAHALKPVVHVGREGVTDRVGAEIELALEAHELIKIRLGGDRAERAELLERVTDRIDCAVAGSVGAVAVLYRPHADPALRKIGV